MSGARAGRLIPVAVLYGGRLGVAGLGLVVLPWFSRVMPAEQFGLTATILALQALAVVLDLGLSIHIARDFPLLSAERHRREHMRRSERTLLILYLAVTGIAIALAMIGVLQVRVSTIVLICLSLMLIVWQNLIVVAFVGRQRYIISTLSQFTSLLLRHGFSLAIIIGFGANVENFLLGQIMGAALVLGLSRPAFHSGQAEPPQSVADPHRSPSTISAAAMIYTIAGASALQLDKVLLSTLSSPASTGPYFLASTLSLVPITFLAAPVSQFVQPKLVAALGEGRTVDSMRWIIRLVLSIFVLAVIPGIVFGLASEWIVGLWLQGAPQQLLVSRYAAILMPGAAIGALGFAPTIVLIARRDYRGLAIISGLLTLAVLSTTTFLAARDDIAAVCTTYSLYHVAAALALWWRATRIEPCFANLFAIRNRTANGEPASTPQPGAPQP